MHQLTVVDGDALRRVLDAVWRHAGSQRKAARLLEIGQPSFQKLLMGKTAKRIGAGTFRRLLDVVRRELPDHEAALLSSVRTDAAAHLARLYNGWVVGSIRRLAPYGLPVLRALERRPEYRGLVESFSERVTGRPTIPGARSVEDRRVRLALLRALEPLGDAERTWGVERSWKELDERGCLRAFLRYSLERERILLKFRGRYLQRMNQLADSDAFREYLLDTEVEIPAEDEVDVAQAFADEPLPEQGRITP